MSGFEMLRIPERFIFNEQSAVYVSYFSHVIQHINDIFNDIVNIIQNFLVFFKTFPPEINLDFHVVVRIVINIKFNILQFTAIQNGFSQSHLYNNRKIIYIVFIFEKEESCKLWKIPASFSIDASVAMIWFPSLYMEETGLPG